MYNRIVICGHGQVYTYHRNTPGGELSVRADGRCAPCGHMKLDEWRAYIADTDTRVVFINDSAPSAPTPTQSIAIGMVERRIRDVNHIRLQDFHAI